MSSELIFLEDSERSIAAATISPTEESQIALPASKANSFAVLTIDGTTRVELEGPALFGREPTSNFVEGQPVHHVKIDASVVSRQHVAMIESKKAVVVLDLGSSNGTVLHRADHAQALKPHKPVELRAGDLVMLGKMVSIQVESL